MYILFMQYLHIIEIQTLIVFTVVNNKKKYVFDIQ